jgi:hypothetical protein
MGFEVRALQVNYPEPEPSGEPEKKREPIVLDMKTFTAGVLIIIAELAVIAGFVAS